MADGDATTGGTGTQRRRLSPEEVAGAIYGTIVCAGVIAATAPDSDPNVLYTGIAVVVTVLVFWLAHAWAHTLGQWTIGTRGLRALRHALATDWPLVLSAIPPLIAMAVAKLLGATDRGALFAAVVLCVVELASLGAVIARRSRAAPLETLLAMLGCGLLGAILVVLKVLVH